MKVTVAQLKQIAEESPELVARMGVILLGGERSITGQAAQNHHPGVSINDRCKR